MFGSVNKTGLVAPFPGSAQVSCGDKAQEGEVGKVSRDFWKFFVGLLSCFAALVDALVFPFFAVLTLSGLVLLATAIYMSTDVFELVADSFVRTLWRSSVLTTTVSMTLFSRLVRLVPQAFDKFDGIVLRFVAVLISRQVSRTVGGSIGLGKMSPRARWFCAGVIATMMLGGPSADPRWFIRLPATAISFSASEFLLRNDYDTDFVRYQSGLQVFLLPVTPALASGLLVFFTLVFGRGYHRNYRPEKREREVLKVSARWASVATRTGLVMSRAAEFLPDKILDRVGNEEQGVASDPTVRNLALLGDRSLALCVAQRASSETWTVSEASDVSQYLLTNATLARFFDQKLTPIFPSLASRSEKRKGTLVEAIVGIARKSGAEDAAIDRFVFGELLAAVGPGPVPVLSGIGK